MLSHSVGSFASILLTGVLLVQSMTAQQAQPGSGIEQANAALPPNAHVELHLTDGSSIHGRIASHADNDFVLKQDSGRGLQTISYQQVRSVALLKSNHSRAKWIIIGVVAGAAIVVAVIAVYAVHHLNV